MSGDFRREMVAAPLAILAFWCGMAVAAHAYPGGYDWPYQTISVLLYPDHNPHGFVWAWAGVELCGLAGIWWTTGVPARAIASPSSLGHRLLQLGFLFMCCTVLPGSLLPVPRGHELFAILAFLGLCMGVTCQMWALGATREPDLRRSTPRRIKGGIRRALPLLPLVPLALAGLTQAYLTLVRPGLPWVSPRWRSLGVSPLLSFGVWEWVSCVVLSVCLLMLGHRRRS